MARGLFEGWHIIVLVVWLAFVGSWLAALIDAIRRPDSQWRAAGQSKVLFVVLIVFLGLLGALIYLIIPLGALRRAEASPAR